VSVWIKICGTTNVADADQAISAGANAVGFIFASGPRRIAPLDARGIVTVLPATIQRVGVFVNEKPERVREIVDRVKLTAVQLHGDETPAYARNLFTVQRAAPPSDDRFPEKRARGTRIFKVIRMDDHAEENIRVFSEQQGLVDAIVLDSATRVRGGSGKPFDWTAAAALMKRFDGKARFIVAGGLRPENVEEAIRTMRPWGVDVVTGVEKQPGIKNPLVMRAFVDVVRQVEKKL
jgi:phosphoribosylanthranilate isomerase